MKIKSLLSFFVPAALMALSVASCSDYDNGYDAKAIKFQEAFRETFGDIDPDQDWNLAERANITVSTQQESNIKIYALEGDEYTIVGDYEGVKGTRMLGIDVIEGTRNLLVSDGRTAQKCAPGDVVTFGQMSTRTVYEGSTSIGNNQYVTVTKLTQNVNDLGDNKNYPAYRTSTKEEVQGMLNIIPQAVNNLNKPEVKNNFTYVSTGSFIIYPFYWYTSSRNTLGLYYKDNNNQEHWIPIITPNDVDVSGTTELWYQEGNQLDTSSDTPMNASSWSRSGDNSNVGFFQTQSSTDSQYDDASGVNAKDNNPFLEVWTDAANDLGTQSFSQTFPGFTPNAEYRVEVKARLVEQESGKDKISDMDNVSLSANGVSVNMTYQSTCVKTKNSNNQPLAYPNMGGQKTMWVTCKADANGKINVSLNLDRVHANWFSFKDLTFHKLDGSNTHDEQARGHEYFATNGGVKGQGIRVDIPEGIQFSIYLDKTDANGTYRIYSDGKMNESDSRLVGARKENGEYDFPTCYASTFFVGEQMFIGFEDWPGTTGGDYDLNDMVFTFDGKKPIIINEDPTPKAWMLACEDLGGTFDRDYNDVVFKVEHISGQTTATVTPLAAGGTLASYIFYVSPTNQETAIGEIHQLFGFPAAISGEYEPHNAKEESRGQAGRSVPITVPEDWSMALYSTNTFGLSQNEYYNMGGFEIRTLPIGHDPVDNASSLSVVNAESSGASRIPAPDPGAAPYIICIPYSYVELNTPASGQKTETFWAWPQELVTIDGCYPDFPGWVADHKTNGEWYKNRREGSATVEELKIVTSMSSTILPSPLGHLQETVYVVKSSGPDVNGRYYYDVNNYEDLRANLTGVTSGTLSYFYMDGEIEKPLTADHLLYNGGPRTIIVKQAEDGTYAAGQTSFTLNVNDAVTKTDPTFTIKTMNVVNNSWGGYSETAGNSHSVSNVTAGTKVWIGCTINGNPYQGNDQNFTATISDGGTGSSVAQWVDGYTKPGEFMVTTGSNVGGTITVSIHFSGDDQYNAKDITVTINTTRKVNLKSHVNNLYWGLAINQSGQLKIVNNNSSDNSQNWYLEAPLQSNGQPLGGNAVWLRNAATNDYLSFETGKHDDHSPFNAVISTAKPINAQSARFIFSNGINNGGKISDLYDPHNYYYIGVTSTTNDGSGAFPAGLIFDRNNDNNIHSFEIVNIQ